MNAGVKKNRMDTPPTTPEWYAQGLRFSCTQCGNCCTGPEGYVWFNLEELKAMADHVGQETSEFLVRYARKIDGAYSLNEVQRDGRFDCVFLKPDPQTGQRGCSIYPVRPSQCRTWPFWPENLSSRRAWNSAARNTPCPGMQTGDAVQGRHYTLHEIRLQLAATAHE